MSKHPSRALVLALVTLVTSVVGSAPVRAQSVRGIHLPRPTAFAVACTGNTYGGGLGFAGQQRTEAGFDPAKSLCDSKEGPGAYSSTSTYPGVAPQHLEAHAAVTWGEIKTFASLTAQNWQNQGLYFPGVLGQAGFVDDITLDAPGLTGQAGTAVGTVHLNGLLQSVGYQGNAAFSFAVMVGNNFPAPSRHLYIGGGYTGTHAQSVLIDEYVNVAIDFIYGTPFAMGVFGWSAASTSSEGGLNHLSGVALSDFEHTMQWTGLSSVTANGNAVSGYTATSASGDDWILGPNAVVATPEPATVVLLATGLLAVVGVSRRRTRG